MSVNESVYWKIINCDTDGYCKTSYTQFCHGDVSDIPNLSSDGLVFTDSCLIPGNRLKDRESSILHGKFSTTIPLAHLLKLIIANGAAASCRVGYSLTGLAPVKTATLSAASALSPPSEYLTDGSLAYQIYYSGSYHYDTISSTFTIGNGTCHALIKDSGYERIISQDYDEKKNRFLCNMVKKSKSGQSSHYYTQARANKPFYLAIPLDELKRACGMYNSLKHSAQLRYSHTSWTVPQFPLEESFLEDFYKVLDRPSFNAWATIFDIVGGVKSTRKLTDVFKSIKMSGGIRTYIAQNAPDYLDKHSKLKTASDLYLTRKYIYDTTRMDIDDFQQKLLSRLSRPDTRVYRRRFSPTTTFYENLTVESQHCIRVHYLGAQQSAANLYGFDMPMEAVWDLIPYSFVVDWFCGIGDCLSSIEMAEAVNQINVVSCTESIKRIEYSNGVDPVLNIPVLCTRTLYRRDATTHLPPIYPSSPSISNPFLHIKEGAALLFSKKE